MDLHNIEQEILVKTIHIRIRNKKRQNGCLRRLYKYLRKEEKLKTKEKRKIYSFECRVPKNSKER